MKNNEIKKLIGDILLSEDSQLDAKSLTHKVDGFLSALKPFGFLVEQNGEIEINEAIAERFFLSFISFHRNKLKLISDWQRLGGEFKNPDVLFEKGIRLLSLIEKKRSEIPDAKPLLKFKIVKALILGIDINDNEYYLTHLDDKSHFYQMIGGKIKNNESIQEAILREMYEEIPNFSLKNNIDFCINQITEKPHFVQFVSPKYGSFTEYEVHYFIVEFKKPFKLSGSLRWIKKEAYLSGLTEDGFGLIPQPKEFENIYNKLNTTSKVKPLLVETEGIAFFLRKSKESVDKKEVENLKKKHKNATDEKIEELKELKNKYKKALKEKDKRINELKLRVEQIETKQPQSPDITFPRLDIGINKRLKYCFRLNFPQKGIKDFIYEEGRLSKMFKIFLSYAIATVESKESVIHKNSSYDRGKFNGYLKEKINLRLQKENQPVFDTDRKFELLIKSQGKWKLSLDKDEIKIIGKEKIKNDPELIAFLSDYLKGYEMNKNEFK